MERQSFIVEMNNAIDVVGNDENGLKTKQFTAVEVAGVIQNRYHKGFNIESMQAGHAAIIATFDEKYSGQYTITPNEHVSTTLKVSSPPAIATDMFVRRLTPLECERLMGWPDNYTANGIDDNGNEIKISDTQRYKICGNGIGTPVTKWIGDQFMKLEKGEL
jgi:site-specific DNA-cytosine methylase